MQWGSEAKAALEMFQAEQSVRGFYALDQGHIYAGTVPAHVKARRRAKNRRARAARRLNRRG